ncbi:hypothetical protein VDG1235_3946 [Verrucomicrobiia bacterium DG1235]|nr:hypothetical protein VDG1235_3946 [Verrucomicrobiae bacterium DG1235]
MGWKLRDAGGDGDRICGSGRKWGVSGLYALAGWAGCCWGWGMLRLKFFLPIVVCLCGFASVETVHAQWAGDAGRGEYLETNYRPILANGRYAPTRPGDANASRIRAGGADRQASVFEEELPRQASRSGRFEPRRPGEAETGGAAVGSGRGRFEPRRPGDGVENLNRNDDLGTALDGYRVLRGEELSADFVAAEPWMRDFEGTAKMKVKKALWKKVVTVPVKVVFKTVKKTIWKVAVGSWMPVL